MAMTFERPPMASSDPQRYPARLPDARLADPVFLTGNMTEAQYLDSGTNNDVWRIALPGTRAYVLRVSRRQRDLFTDPAAAVQATIRPAAAMNARAAQPLVMFHAQDADGVTREVGDVQPEMRARCWA